MKRINTIFVLVMLSPLNTLAGVSLEGVPALAQQVLKQCQSRGECNLHFTWDLPEDLGSIVRSACNVPKTSLWPKGPSKECFQGSLHFLTQKIPADDLYAYSKFKMNLGLVACRNVLWDKINNPIGRHLCFENLLKTLAPSKSADQEDAPATMWRYTPYLEVIKNACFNSKAVLASPLCADRGLELLIRRPLPRNADEDINLRFATLDQMCSGGFAATGDFHPNYYMEHNAAATAECSKVGLAASERLNTVSEMLAHVISQKEISLSELNTRAVYILALSYLANNALPQDDKGVVRYFSGFVKSTCRIFEPVLSGKCMSKALGGLVVQLSKPSQMVLRAPFLNATLRPLLEVERICNYDKNNASPKCYSDQLDSLSNFR